MICRKCGAEIPDDSVFCQACGTPVNGSDQKIVEGNGKNDEAVNAEQKAAENTVSETEKKDQAVQIEKETAASVDSGQNNAAPVMNDVQKTENGQPYPNYGDWQANQTMETGYGPNQAQQGQFGQQQFGQQQFGQQQFDQQGQFAQQQMPYYQPAPQRSGGGFAPAIKAIPKKVWIIAIAAAAAIVALVLFINLKPTVVSLNKYITITTTGYDSVGKASATFNSEEFLRDYYGKIKVKNAFYDYVRQEMGSLFSSRIAITDSMVMEFLEEQISGNLDRTSDLSNGDQIKYVWKCNDEVLGKFLKVKLNYSDIPYTVENLKPVEKKDIFADISLSYSGVAPTGRIDNVINPEGLALKYSKSEGLSNGDKITVTASIGDASSFITQHGWLPKELTKEYEVSGLPSYVRAISDINSTSLDAMKKEAGDQIASYIARSYSPTTVTEGLTYAGAYLLTAKKPGSSGTYNHFYIVYSAKVSNTENKFEPTTVYYPIRFDNLLVDGTGVVSYKSVSSVIGKSYLTPNSYSWSTSGYTNGTIMYSEIITENRNSYNYEVSPELAQFGS